MDYRITCSNLFTRIPQPSVDQDAATYPRLPVHFLVLAQDVEAWVRVPCEPRGWRPRAPMGCARFPSARCAAGGPPLRGGGAGSSRAPAGVGS
eukprot:2529622-Pyramimonas_sp.AAC.1